MLISQPFANAIAASYRSERLKWFAFAGLLFVRLISLRANIERYTLSLRMHCSHLI